LRWWYDGVVPKLNYAGPTAKNPPPDLPSWVTRSVLIFAGVLLVATIIGTLYELLDMLGSSIHD
jgi:hypothetical protein